jgi:hypothetical protein
MKLDLIAITMTDYHTTLNDCVRETYLAAYSVLEKTYLTRKRIYEDCVREAMTQEEFADAHSDLSFEKDRWNEQTGALAAMALTMISSANKSFLDQMKGLVGKSCPPDPKGYQGSSQLQKRVAEYKSRFGIDLEKITTFDTIREIELARNCCVHESGKLTNEYVEQTKQRIVGEDGYINMTPRLMDELLLEIADCSRQLCTQMKAFRDFQTS